MVAVVLLALVYAVLAICVLCTVFGGKKLGLYGVLLRVGVVTVSCILSFVTVKLLSPVLLDTEISLLSSLHLLPNDLMTVLSHGEGGRALVGVFTGGILLPVLFMLLALLLTVIGTVIVHFTAKKLPKGSVGGGIGVGILHGLLLAIVILFPILSFEGLYNTAAKNSPALKASLEKSLGTETVESLDTATSANVVELLLGDNVVKWTVKGMTATSFEGGRTDLYSAVTDVCEVIEVTQSMSGNGMPDLLSMSPEESEDITKLLLAIDHSPLLSSALSDFVAVWAEAWAEGRTFMGMTSPTEGADPAFAPVFEEMFHSLAASDRENVTDNLGVTLNVMSAWSGAGEDGKLEAVKDILDTLGESEEMAAVATEIKLTGMRTFMQDEIPALKDEEKYDEAISSVLGLVEDHEPTVEEVSSELGDILLEYDYELSDEKCDSAAAELVEKRNELGRPLTEEELADLYFEKIGHEE